ncbi:MAG TPA: hypothetical protein VG796_19500 [Verrucomicrobiales bacterium]|nr:hypothetical protein [Verrucomicrobiales bacterium]
MPSVRKSKSAFAAAAAPVLLAFGSGLVKMFAGDNAELGNWLVESFTGLAAGVAGNVYHEHSQTTEHAATFITGGQLCTHTGSVMEALTLEFAETEDGKDYRKPLRTLAGKLPALWQSLCSDEGPVTGNICHIPASTAPPS